MPLVQGSSRQAISENIRRERDAHKPLKQAIAIAMDVARRNRAEGGRAEDIGYAPDVPSTAARDVGYAPDASLPDRRDEDYLRRLAILAPPAQPRPLNMLGDALYGLGRSLSGPAANPIQPAQDAAYGAFKGMTVDPVVEAYNAVKGRMTEDEQRNMLFGAAIGLLPMGRAAKGAMPAGIRAFHSSPHDFERFDASKIGTGEGAQVYGYGHYFAENPKVSGRGGEYWKQFLDRFTGTREGEAARELMQAKFDRARALENIQKDISGIEWMGPENTNLNDLLAVRELIKSGNPVGPRTYEVNLKARPEQFLDWDRPLVQQGDVLSSVNKVAPNIVNAEEANMRAALAALKQKYPSSDPMGQQAAIQRGLARFGEGTGFTGKDVYNKLVMRAPNRGGPEYVAASLREAGIPGIRYLDQGSRNAGDWHLTPPNHTVSGKWMVKSSDYNSKGLHFDTEAEALAALAAKQSQRTSNYVMFPGTEHLIDITKKYALPTAVLGGLAVQNRQDYAEGGRADEKPKPPIPRPNPFRQSQPLSSSSRPPVYGMLAQSYRNLERQMGNPEIDRVMLGLDKIKNYPELRPTTQQDLDKYWAGRGEFYRTINRLKMDPAAVDRMPQSENIEYRWPVTPDDLYGDQYVREPLGAIRNYASGGRAGQAIQRAGLITSTVPGRTDKHSINVLSGSYILPADHVAHLGQDNSLAGGKVLDSMFGASRKRSPAAGDIVPIVVAGGEYLLEPDQVESVGNGDLTRGHNALDAWVKSARKKHVALLKSLPPPKTK
jgi:hypothetical protein